MNPVDLPERVDTRSARTADVPAAEPEPAGAADPVPALSPAARAARRRRRVLAGLLALVALGVALVPVVGTPGWVVAGGSGAALVVFLLAAWRAVRRGAMRDAPRTRLAGAVAAEPVDAVLVDAEPVVASARQRRAEAAPVLFDQELVEQEPAAEEPSVVSPAGHPAPLVAAAPTDRAHSGEAHVRREQGAVPAPRVPRVAEEAPAAAPPRRRRSHAVTADGTWTPIPVPTPMYLTAPRVPYPSTPRRPAPAARTRQTTAARQRASAGYGVRRAVNG